jgi:uncharacterized protein (TIGR03083 family)
MSERATEPTDPVLQQGLAALRHSRDHLAAVVGSMTGDEVERPSYHSWSIAQVLSHLGSGAEIFQLRLAAGYPGGSSPGDDEIHPIWDRWNAKPPRQQVQDALAADDDLVAAFTDAAAKEDGSWRLDLFGTEQDLAGLVQMRLSEHALHTWDVAVALDPTVVLPGDAVALVVDRLDALVAWTGRPQPGLQVRVETTGAERVFLLTESDDRAVLTATDPAVTGTDLPTLRLPAEALVRLVYGRLDAEHTPVGVQADGLDLDDMRKVFPGP